MIEPKPPSATLAQELASLDQADFFGGSPVAMFVINADHVVTHFNQACAMTLGVPADRVIGTRVLGRIFYGHDRPVMAELIVDGAMTEIMDDLYQNNYRRSLAIPCGPAPPVAPRWLPHPVRRERGRRDAIAGPQ